MKALALALVVAIVAGASACGTCCYCYAGEYRTSGLEADASRVRPEIVPAPSAPVVVRY